MADWVKLRASLRLVRVSVLERLLNFAGVSVVSMFGGNDTSGLGWLLVNIVRRL